MIEVDEFAEGAILAGQDARLVLDPRARMEQLANRGRRYRGDLVEDDHRIPAALDHLVGRLLVVRRRRVARARIRQLYVPARPLNRSIRESIRRDDPARGKVFI